MQHRRNLFTNATSNFACGVVEQVLRMLRVAQRLINGFLSVFHFLSLIRAAKTPFWGTLLDFAAVFGQCKIMP